MASEYPDTVTTENVPQSNTLVTRSCRHIVSIWMELYHLVAHVHKNKRKEGARREEERKGED